MKPHNIIKRNNSKGNLAKAVIQLQQALLWYAKEENWAVKEDDIMWVGDDDPLRVAEIVLGKRKPEPVRKPDVTEVIQQKVREFNDEFRKQQLQQAGGAEGDGGSPPNVEHLDSADAGREVRGHSYLEASGKVNQIESGALPDDLRVRPGPGDKLDQLGDSGVHDSSPDRAIEAPKAS